MKIGDSGYLDIVKQKNINDKINSEEDKKLREVSEEFEAIFVKQLLDGMEKTIDRKNSMFHGGNAEEIFRGMLNEKTAQNMAATGDFGIAKMLYEQLSKTIKRG